MPQTAPLPREADRLPRQPLRSQSAASARQPRSRQHVAAALLAAILALLGVAPAAAQYAPAGGGVAPLPNRQGQLESAISESRWRLGPFHVAPWIGLRNVSYQQNLLDPDDDADLTATLGAGVRAYLRARDTAILATHVLPEYVWWNEQEDRREVIGRYGVGLFTFLNRLQLEATARRVEDLEFASDELLVRVPQTLDRFDVAAQLRLAGSIAAFAGVSENRFRFEPFEDQEGLQDLGTLLDRNQRTTRVGLRYLLPATRGHVGLGAQIEETSFEAAEGPSNEGDGIYGEINLLGNKMDVHLDGALRRLEAAEGSDFPEVEELTGSAGVVFRMGWRITPNLYWRKGLSYPVTGDGPYLADTRIGVRLAIRLVRELQLQTFYETGEMDFAESGRVDDIEAYGASMAIPLHRVANLNLGARRSEYDSNEPGQDRGFEEAFANFVISFGSGSTGEW
jgi:hypothetical protein